MLVRRLSAVLVVTCATRRRRASRPDQPHNRKPTGRRSTAAARVGQGPPRGGGQETRRRDQGSRRAYQHLHANPELSLMETKTAARLAEEMKKLGYEVTEKVGGNGVVAVLKNGPGPVVLIRTDMDALPIIEQTGLPYASKVQVKDRPATRSA